ncbi:MAG TPA: DUF6629 family protein [Chitinophagaceae bacterium]|nr:DUF6629 family protein [Chitinophagaceae bacterium]
MCFSATASFAASVVIGAIGTITLASCNRPAERWLASVPLLFALQQLAEGFVWLSFTHSAFTAGQHTFTLCFLFLAWVVWPVLIPLAFYKLEPPGPRRTWCRRLIFVGTASALYATFNLLAKYPVPDIATCHIIYHTQKLYRHELFFVPHQTAYILATVLPMFLSSLKGVKVLALTNFCALVFCFYLFQYALPSTWCFFAALLSSMIYLILRRQRQPAMT